MVIGSFSYHKSLWRDVAMCIDHFSSKKLSTREEIVGEKSAWVNLFTIARHGTVAARHISDVRGWHCRQQMRYDVSRKEANWVFLWILELLFKSWRHFEKSVRSFYKFCVTFSSTRGFQKQIKTLRVPVFAFSHTYYFHKSKRLIA